MLVKLIMSVLGTEDEALIKSEKIPYCYGTYMQIQTVKIQTRKYHVVKVIF